MKQMSQMKEMIIAAVAVATLMSCQSEKDKLIDSKISSIDARLELVDYELSDFDKYDKLMQRKGEVRRIMDSGDTLYELPDYTEEELKLIGEIEWKVNYSSQLKEEREFWVLQK